MKALHIFAVLVTTLIFYCQDASAWWNEQWPYRKAITIDASPSGANLTENVKGVPVLLKLHTGNFKDFFAVKQNLGDLRFISEDGTPLKHHVEHFDLVNEFIYVWVRIPQITGGISTEKFWMYYGNQQASSIDDPAATFDDDTGLVYHFASKQGLPQDSTAYNNHAERFSGNYSDKSLIAYGARFESGDRLSVADQPALALLPAKGMTVSFWMKPLGNEQDAVVVERVSGKSSLAINVQKSNISSEITNSSGARFQTTPTPAVTTDAWQHVALTLTSDQMTLYVNGNEVAATSISLEPMVGSWSMGGAVDGSQNFVGDIDEFRISSAARSSQWINASVSTQGLNNSLLNAQQSEQLGGGGGGSGIWGVMFSSVEESGWVVMCLLAVMAIFSWLVMIGKFVYVRRVNLDNEGFLAEYQKIKHNNPALLDYEESEDDKDFEKSPIMQAIFGKHDHYQSSPIYRIYHKGIQEVQTRLAAAQHSKAAGLDSETVEAIKATVDAQIIREVQRLNSKMVFLTIAISGGPFLGLLGTVLGVMITFAAIAITGDVNISAIAPGVAAALLTTVAGLTVAIPALFGYNYLTTRLKEASADMRVFADEFVTKLAEYYRADRRFESRPSREHREIA